MDQASVFQQHKMTVFISLAPSEAPKPKHCLQSCGESTLGQCVNILYSELTYWQTVERTLVPIDKGHSQALKRHVHSLLTLLVTLCWSCFSLTISLLYLQVPKLNTRLLPWPHNFQLEETVACLDPSSPSVPRLDTMMLWKKLSKALLRLRLMTFALLSLSAEPDISS